MKIIIDPEVRFKNENKLVKNLSKLGKKLGLSKNVKIVLTKKHEDCDGKRGYMYTVPGKKNAYIVGVNHNSTEAEILETLGHELQHVKQYDCGDLKTIINEKEGTVKKIWKGEDHTKTPYWTQPWEVEAREKQEENAKLLA